MVSADTSQGFSYEITHAAESGLARAGVISTPHGQIQTPAFIPVGTKANAVSYTHLTLPTIYSV